MRIIPIISIFILLGCNYDNNDFYYCANKAGLFSREETFPLRFDTIKNFGTFKILANSIRDTLQFMIPFGYIYNYADSSFIPNTNPKYNIIIEGLIIIPIGSNIDLGGPYLKVFISSDSVEIIDHFKNVHVKLHKSDNRIKTTLNDYYNNAYNVEENRGKGKYIHIILPDSLNFDEYLLPYLRITLNSYKTSVEKYLLKKETNICDSSKFNVNNSETLSSLSFGTLIDDFDFENREPK